MFIGKLLTLQPPPPLPHLTLRRNLRNVKTIITHKKIPQINECQTIPPPPLPSQKMIKTC